MRNANSCFSDSFIISILSWGVWDTVRYPKLFLKGYLVGDFCTKIQRATSSFTCSFIRILGDYCVALNFWLLICQSKLRIKTFRAPYSRLNLRIKHGGVTPLLCTRFSQLSAFFPYDNIGRLLRCTLMDAGIKKDTREPGKGRIREIGVTGGRSDRGNRRNKNPVFLVFLVFPIGRFVPADG